MTTDDTPQADSRPEPQPRIISSGELLGRENELVISHKGETYRLRVTRNDKLILTK